MLPRLEIIAWREQAPWADDTDVEQDLIITRALLGIFADPFLCERLAFRGGTALHRLYLAPPARYSEDIDLVQRVPEGIGVTFDRLREVLAWMGKPKREVGEIPKLWFTFVSDAGVKRKLKVEINTHEHFGHVLQRQFEVDHDLMHAAVSIPTYSIDELLATKLRAFCQRDKGRDLFDLWWSHQHATIDPGEIVRLFTEYMTKRGVAVDSAPELRAKTLAKQEKRIFDDVRPLLRAGIDYDPAEALEWFEEAIIARLRNDDGTRRFARKR